MRKIYVLVQTRLVIHANDDVEVGEVIQEMDYDFTSKTDGADIVDTEIVDYELQDSK